jgi:hypothetical protein
VLLEGPAAGGEVEARDGHARLEHLRELVHGFGQGTADGDDDLALVVVDLGPGALIEMISAKLASFAIPFLRPFVPESIPISDPLSLSFNAFGGISYPGSLLSPSAPQL